MIAIEQASRWYGQVIGVNDVTCEIGPGVTALLGQNGAGKSTLMRLITGQLRPTTGSVTIFGQSPFANPEVFKRLGFCPDIDSFHEHLSGREFVYRMARLMNIPHAEAKEKTEAGLIHVGMADRAAKPIQGYSKGMRQRIKLASAMIHDPEVLLLDEPLNGLDPVGRREFMDVLNDLSARGKTILVSSHILFEVEQMTSSILLLHRGRLLASGNLRSIRELIDSHPHRVRINTDQHREIAARLMALPFVVSVQIDELTNEIEVQTREPDRFYSELANLSLNDGLRIESFESPDNSLEAVFQYLVESK